MYKLPLGKEIAIAKKNSEHPTTIKYELGRETKRTLHFKVTLNDEWYPTQIFDIRLWKRTIIKIEKEAVYLRSCCLVGAEPVEVEQDAKD